MSDPNYSHYSHVLSSSEFIFSRVQQHSANDSELDVYADFWSFFWADLEPDILAIQCGSHDIPLNGKLALVSPPHSLLYWKFLKATKIHWQVYASCKSYPSNFPAMPTFYSFDETILDPLKFNSSLITKVVTTAPIIQTLDKTPRCNYSKKLKQWIDTDYKDNISLSEYCCRLGLAKETVIRYFKKSYGITPVYYRNQKRIKQILFDLHFNLSKTSDLSFNNGFNDLKQFNQLFKSTTQTQPGFFKKNVTAVFE